MISAKPGRFYSRVGHSEASAVLVFLITLCVFVLVISAMAVGVATTGRRLSGSCGGTGASCACSAEKRARCKEGSSPHADTPIEPQALTRAQLTGHRVSPEHGSEERA